MITDGGAAAGAGSDVSILISNDKVEEKKAEIIIIGEENAEKVEKVEKAEKVEKVEKVENVEKAEKVDKIEEEVHAYQPGELTAVAYIGIGD